MKQVSSPDRADQRMLIALGSNLTSGWGNAGATLREAVVRLQALSAKPVKVSKFYRTPAFPPGSGPDYVNAAVSMELCALPQDVLANLHTIERAAGRQRSERWGQRTLDLDLLAADHAVLPDKATHAYWRGLSMADQKSLVPDELILPHPRLQDRPFVLVPLADVAPDWRHPLLDKTVAEMCATLSEDEKREIVAIDRL